MDLDKKLNQLPVLDWELSMKMAGGKREVAEEILSMLLDTLPNEKISIQSLYEQQQIADLTQRVHKLHGAVCYCGTPRLKIVLNHIETQLKNNIMDDLPILLDRLSKEIDCLLEQRPRPLS
jgi:two-component system sensor histidine kinase BarA